MTNPGDPNCRGCNTPLTLTDSGSWCTDGLYHRCWDCRTPGCPNNWRTEFEPKTDPKNQEVPA